MNKKEVLLRYVGYMLESAKNRGTAQGVMIYEIAIDQIQNAESDADLDDILRRLNRALAGIEAHGGFTNDEYGVVRDLRAMQEMP